MFSLLWHPHQGLANAPLVRGAYRVVKPRRLAALVVRLLIGVDTCILAIRAVLRRVRTGGMSRIFRRPRLESKDRILYVDVGTHRDGAELALVMNDFLISQGPRVSAVGFEANAASFGVVSATFESDPRVHLVHGAVCESPPANGHLTLYKSPDGRGDSIVLETDHLEQVPALRLSESLRAHVADNEQWILIIRMNIEGAEFDVIRELVSSGMATQVDGWFGMWDDVGKIDSGRDLQFRALLKEQGIRKCTFNDRDLEWPFRRRLIRYEFDTAIYRGMARLGEQPAS